MSNSALIDMAWVSRRRNQMIHRNGGRTYDNYGYARLTTDRESIEIESPTKSQSVSQIAFLSCSCPTTIILFCIQHFKVRQITQYLQGEIY